MNKIATKRLFQGVLLSAITASWIWVSLGEANAQDQGATIESRQAYDLLPLESPDLIALDNLIASAMARNPEIQALREKVAQAQGLYVQSGLRPNPTLNLAGETDAESTGAADRSFGLSYSHIFETGGKRQRRIDVAQQEVTIAEQQLAESRRNVAGELRANYLQAMTLGQTIGTQQELTQVTGTLVDIVARRVQQGETAAIQLTQARVENSRVTAELQLLQSRRRAVLSTIRSLAGLDIGSPLRVEGQVHARKLPVAPESLVQLALRTRPDLNAARAEVSRVEAEIGLLKAQRIPDLTGSFRYSYARTAFDLFGLDSQGRLAPIREVDHGISAELTFELPVRDRNQGRLAAAAAEMRSVQFHVRSLEASIRQEVTVACERYEAAYDSLRILQAEVLEGTRASLSTLRDAYQVGEIPFSDVLNEQRRLFELQAAYNDVVLEYSQAAADLTRAIAVPIP